MNSTASERAAGNGEKTPIDLDTNVVFNLKGDLVIKKQSKAQTFIIILDGLHLIRFQAAIATTTEGTPCLSRWARGRWSWPNTQIGWRASPSTRRPTRCPSCPPSSRPKSSTQGEALSLRVMWIKRLRKDAPLVGIFQVPFPSYAAAGTRKPRPTLTSAMPTTSSYAPGAPPPAGSPRRRATLPTPSTRTSASSSPEAGRDQKTLRRWRPLGTGGASSGCPASRRPGTLSARSLSTGTVE